MTHEDSELITIREAAKILGVHLETLRRWDKEGKLQAIRVGELGHRRYRREIIYKLLSNRH